MRIAVVDDDLSFTEKITKLLYEIGKKNDISVTVDSYPDGMTFADSTKEYEVVFLDIQMPEIDGFDGVYLPP